MICADANLASARVIEHHHGRLDSIRDTALGPARRYWLPTSTPHAEFCDQV